jgi:single-strand DNA-binding protein
MNRVILIGNLTADPELRTINSSTSVAHFTLAVNRPTKNDKKAADFIPVIVWSKLAESCSKYLGKGSQVAVAGRLQIRSYDDSQGIRRKAAEVIANEVKFLSFTKKDGAAEVVETEEISEDDVPF